MSMERERSRVSEDIKPAVNPLNFHEMGTDANAPDAVSLVPRPEPAIETPGRKRPKLVTTLTLTSDNCRWPFGDPTKSGFHYCGRLPQSGRPYCDTHDRMSYQSGPRRKPS
jgi:hypothetical protein